MPIGGCSSPSIDSLLVLLSLCSFLPLLSLLTTAMFCCFRSREPQVSDKSESCCTTWSTVTTDDLRGDDRTVTTSQPSSSFAPTVVNYTPDLSTIKAGKDGYQPMCQETDTTPRVKVSPKPKRCTPKSRNLTSRSDDTLVGHPSIVTDHESTLFMATERMDTVREVTSAER